eukprot:TRINITY_DN1269_c0_g1_i12.p1 TRINITY_DN1269_c0_g1~~TRINITY_DN1269_c0_g1_i12.p1  ORF type:complete len:541 (-),score=68.42 TRINITY_DN1269_c0_g1_i12:254-1876(-)
MERTHCPVPTPKSHKQPPDFPLFPSILTTETKPLSAYVESKSSIGVPNDFTLTVFLRTQDGSVVQEGIRSGSTAKNEIVAQFRNGMAQTAKFGLNQTSCGAYLCKISEFKSNGGALLHLYYEIKDGNGRRVFSLETPPFWSVSKVPSQDELLGFGAVLEDQKLICCGFQKISKRKPQTDDTAGNRDRAPRITMRVNFSEQYDATSWDESTTDQFIHSCLSIPSDGDKGQATTPKKASPVCKTNGVKVESEGSFRRRMIDLESVDDSIIYSSHVEVQEFFNDEADASKLVQDGWGFKNEMEGSIDTQAHQGEDESEAFGSHHDTVCNLPVECHQTNAIQVEESVAECTVERVQFELEDELLAESIRLVSVQDYSENRGACEGMDSSPSIAQGTQCSLAQRITDSSQTPLETTISMVMEQYNDTTFNMMTNTYQGLGTADETPNVIQISGNSALDTPYILQGRAYPAAATGVHNYRTQHVDPRVLAAVPVDIARQQTHFPLSMTIAQNPHPSCEFPPVTNPGLSRGPARAALPKLFPSFGSN